MGLNRNSEGRGTWSLCRPLVFSGLIILFFAVPTGALSPLPVSRVSNSEPDAPPRIGDPFTGDLDAFIVKNTQATLLGNILFNRYFEGSKWISNPVNGAQRKRLEELSEVFHVEAIAAARVAGETVRDVANINKYLLAYTQVYRARLQRDLQKQSLETASRN